MNTVSWIILGAIISAFVGALWSLLRKKKRGEEACTCGSCSGCPMSGACGKKTDR